ncbi:hypothetical protein ES702_06569 [subsurface metagenome]
MKSKIGKLISAVLIAIPMAAIAQSGWQSNGFGGYSGTGKNQGAGWQSNGFGGLSGTGKNQGKQCTSNGFGGVNCN